MKDLTVKEILDLVVSEVEDAELKIQKMYEWHLEREKLIITWILGAAASLIVSVMISLFKAEIILNWWQTSLVFLGAIATGSYGIYRLYQIRLMHRQFVSALKIYNDFKKISSFLNLYNIEVKA